MIGIQLVTGYSLPQSGPLSLARTKEHLRVTGTSEDGLITGYLWAAIKYVEERTGRAFLSSTWRQTLDRFPRWCGAGREQRWSDYSFGWAVGSILLARNPVTAVASVAYKDATGAPQTIDLANLLVETDCEPARIAPVVGGYWPISVMFRPGAVSVTFTAGYVTSADVPPPIVQAVLLLVGHWYENREAVVVGAAVYSVPSAAEALINLSAVPWLDYEA